MAYPTFTAGQRVTAALLNAGKLEYVSNSAGAQISTSVTVANATGLSFPVEAGARYWVHVLVSYDSADVGDDIRFRWTMPSGATVARNCIYPAVAATTNIDTNVAMIRRGYTTEVIAGGTNAVANAFTLYEEITDMQISSAGTAQFQFGLGTAPGTATLQADSIIYYQRIQ